VLKRYPPGDISYADDEKHCNLATQRNSVFALFYASSFCYTSKDIPFGLGSCIFIGKIDHLHSE
jgi:hypothetical protein